MDETLGDWRHGFWPNRGTMDFVFPLKIMLEENWGLEQKAICGLIGLEKGFDSIARNSLHKPQTVYENAPSRVKKPRRRMRIVLHLDRSHAGRSTVALTVLSTHRQVYEREITLPLRRWTTEERQEALTRWDNSTRRMGTKTNTH